MDPDAALNELIDILVNEMPDDAYQELAHIVVANLFDWRRSGGYSPCDPHTGAGHVSW